MALEKSSLRTKGLLVMDALFIALMLAFFGLTWGFVRLCEKV